MKTRTGIILVLAILTVVACGVVSAGRTLTPSNDTAQITVRTAVSAIGSVSQTTDIVYTQSNGNLVDNPPLAQGEGQNVISYQEDTMAVSGCVTYDSYTNLDTGPVTANGDNFQTQKYMTYDDDGDGTPSGVMMSEESIMVEAMATNGTEGVGACCPWGATSGTVLAATNDRVIAGSDMVVEEAAVASSSSATITADTIDTPVSLSYTVEIEGINQTEGDPSTGAEGRATAFVSAVLQEGNGDSTSMGAEVVYEDETSASGLFTLAKDVSFVSS